MSVKNENSKKNDLKYIILGYMIAWLLVVLLLIAHWFSVCMVVKAFTLLFGLTYNWWVPTVITISLFLFRIIVMLNKKKKENN